MLYDRGFLLLSAVVYSPYRFLLKQKQNEGLWASQSKSGIRLGNNTGDYRPSCASLETPTQNVGQWASQSKSGRRILNDAETNNNET